MFKSYYVVWKLEYFVDENKYISGFKSYYVVWKLIIYFISFKISCLGLNRTMQYGNDIVQLSLIRIYQFKSYYVVWKPLLGCKGIIIFYQFKSYYVVWKPLFISSIFAPVFSLNRTMQYGNDIIIFFVFVSKKFKSYYVVWKLLYFSVFFIILPCLNRTMQYGNSNPAIVFAFHSSSLNRTMQYGNGGGFISRKNNKQV